MPDRLDVVKIEPDALASLPQLREIGSAPEMLDYAEIVLLACKNLRDDAIESRKTVQQRRPIAHHARKISSRARHGVLGVVRQIQRVQPFYTPGGKREFRVGIAGLAEHYHIQREVLRQIFEHRC